MPVNRTNYHSWEIELVKTLFHAGRLDTEIAAALKRPVTGVIQKRHQLGLLRAADPLERVWTVQEIETVKKGHADGLTSVQVAHLLTDRTPDQVRNYMLNKLGLHRYPKKRFTEEEDEILKREFMAYRPRDEIARILGRDLGTLNQRVLKLGLKREQRRSRLARKFAYVATDPRPTSEIVAAIKAEEEAQKQQRTVEAAAAVQAALDRMLNAISMGTERRTAFQAAMLEGVTLQEIGDSVGLTRERIRQIVHRVLPTAALDSLVKSILALNLEDYHCVMSVVEEARGKPVRPL